MIKLYNQNIWGNCGRTQTIANRNELLARLIAENAPDFIHLQECNPGTSRAPEVDIARMISDRYTEAAPGHAHENFTPVFYDYAKYECIESGFMPYDGLNDGGSKSVTWGVFERRSDGFKICMASTHFWYKATGEVDEEQRRENARAAHRVLDGTAKKYNVPVIFSGDLNSGVDSAQGTGGYDELIKLGFSDVRYTAADSTDVHTIHALPVRGDDGMYTCGAQPHRTIDYVLTYGAALDVRKFRVLTSADALASSDHCPMIAEFDV